LKQLQRLEAYYKNGTLTNVWDLCQLEHLEELKLVDFSDDPFADDVVELNFVENVHQRLPKLKSLKTCEDQTEFFMIANLENLNPSALEECFVRLRTEEDV